jgi:hypothetical protein
MKLIQTAKRFIETDYSDLKELSEIEAGQGAGKTTSINSLFTDSVLLVSSSNNLLKQIQARFPDMNWQMHIEDSGHTKKGEALDEYLNAEHCLCNLQSLHLWEAQARIFKKLVIEEADIFFKDSFMYNPPSPIPNLPLKNLTQLIWRMKSTPSVICVGAHSTGFLKTFNEQFIHREHTFYQNVYPDLEGKELIGCDTNAQLRTVIEKQLEQRLSDRSKYGGVYMATEYSNHLTTILEAWKKRFPTLKVKIVKADMRLTEEELRILASDNEYQEWDLLIASPSLRDGFHIMHGFDLVVGDYSQSKNDILTCDEIINAMLRVRTCTRFAVCMKNTKSLTGELKSKATLDKPSSAFVEIPKKLLKTNTETGKLEPSNSIQEIGFRFWSNYRQEETLGRKRKVTLKWEERGGEFAFPPETSKTIPIYQRQNKMEGVLKAEPYKANDWGQRDNEHRRIHTEILQIYGAVSEATYTRWDRGNYKANEERAKRLYKVKERTGDLIENGKIEIDIWTEKLLQEMENSLMITDKDGELYQIHRQVFLNWAIWRQLKANKNKWNKLCKQINLADCEIADRHCSNTTDKCLEWLTVLLRKYNFEVSEIVEAKPQKAKELRSAAEKGHRADFIQWKLEGNKGKQLQSFLFTKLLSRDLSLNGLGRNTNAFLDCYSYINVSPQQLSQRNYIS